MERASGEPKPLPRRVRVKICGVTTPRDALEAEAAGADAVGVNFAAGSPRRLHPERAAEVLAPLSPFVRRVGVFVDAGADEVLDVAARAGLDAVQLHGAEPRSVAAAVRRHLPVLRAVRFEPGQRPEAWADDAHDLLLLDGLRPGSGEAFDWSAAHAWRGHPRLVLAGGLRPDNVAAAIRGLRPFAVDVASGVERPGGGKDAAAMRAFVAAVRAADLGATADG